MDDYLGHYGMCAILTFVWPSSFSKNLHKFSKQKLINYYHYLTHFKFVYRITQSSQIFPHTGYVQSMYTASNAEVLVMELYTLWYMYQCSSHLVLKLMQTAPLLVFCF